LNKLRKFIWDTSGAFSDIGVLLPISIALIERNGLNPSSVFLFAGIFYILSSYYFKITMPVQPLKAMSSIAIAKKLNSQILNSAGLLMGLFLILIFLTNISKKIGKYFSKGIIRGIQFGLGIILIKTGISLVNIYSKTTIYSFFILIFTYLFLKFLPPILPLILFGLISSLNGIENLNFNFPAIEVHFPNFEDLKKGFFILFLPQIALTLSNAWVATEDTAKYYYKERAKKINLKSISLSMGIANIFSSLFGGAPMCHGSGGITAHYKGGARDENSAFIIGFFLIFLGIFFGKHSLILISRFPIEILGILIIYIGFYHSILIKDILKRKKDLIISLIIGIIAGLTNNLTFALFFGLILYYILNSLFKFF